MTSKLPDSTLFKAGTILIKYNPQSILSGRLQATQIVALDPQVFLCEDLDKGRWNWQRAAAEAESRRPATSQAREMKFPEILLRNAQLNYSRLRNGELLHDRGLMEIEGSLKPGEDGGLRLPHAKPRRSRRRWARSIEGDFNMDTKAVNARLLHDFHFGKDIEVMLPEQVRNWWMAARAGGKHRRSPNSRSCPRARMAGEQFRIETDLHDVNLHIHPEEWLSRDENARLAAMRQTMASMRSLGLDEGGFVSKLETFFNPSVIELRPASPADSSSPKTGIDISRSDAAGSDMEKNSSISAGRSTATTAKPLRPSSLRARRSCIPASPRYSIRCRRRFAKSTSTSARRAPGRFGVKIDAPPRAPSRKSAGGIDIHDGQIRLRSVPLSAAAIDGRD